MQYSIAIVECATRRELVNDFTENIMFGDDEQLFSVYVASISRFND